LECEQRLLDADSIIGTLYAIKDLQSLQIDVLRRSDSTMTDMYGECTLKNYKLDDALVLSEAKTEKYRKQSALFKAGTGLGFLLLILCVL